MPVNIETMPKDLGSIIPMILSENEILTTHPDSRYILADGRDVPNTKYETYIGPNVPDLRGCFLRGKNYDRGRGTGNAAGDLPLGQYQLHEFSRHIHNYYEMIADNHVDGVDSTTTNSGEHHRAAAKTLSYGGKETRPNSVTVNYFICIN